MWLFFPLSAVLEMLRTGLPTAGLLAFLASMAGYVAVFLWLMLRYPFRGAVGLTPSEPRIWLLMILAALTLYLELAFGTGIPYHFMFVAIAAAVTLPTRHAVWTVLATTVVAGGIYALRSGWGALGSTWESAVAPFVIVGFSMILISRLVVTVAQLREAREEIARLAVDEERLRFARDLHDLLGHSLSLITLKSELAGKLLPSEPGKASTEIRDIEGVARQALREAREAVVGYRQPTLDGELAGAREMLGAAGIDCRIENEAGTLPGPTNAALAWAVREGTTNVIRHSRAKLCRIRLSHDENNVYADITDDGRGSRDGAMEATGSGLPGLAERFAGGEFEAGPLPGGGFRLRVSLPAGGKGGRR